MTDIVLLGISSVIGSGIFLLPGIAAGVMGPAALVPLLCAGLLCVLVALCYAEVGSRFSATGGAYLYAAEAFGPLVGFSVGWMSWWVRMIAWAALANGFA
ncbi:MAG: amino acid permease, partial [Planctomycetota bacterium]